MRQSILFSLSLLFFSFNLFAQRELNNPLLNSSTVIEKGVAFHDDGKYKQAISEYLKIPASDTNYSRVLHELILSYYNDSNFVDAEKYARIALDMFPENAPEWYGLLADVYDDNKRIPDALNIYDTILLSNPNGYLAYFNKAVTLFRAERYDEATTNFQKCLMLNPYYTSAHYFLGRLSLFKGNLVQAMLSFSTNLLLSPNNRYHKTSTSLLNSIAEVNTAVEEVLKKYKPGKEDDFDAVQDIITSKIALDKNYKLQADIEDQIVRQLQAMMEKLEYNANDKGFWMQYYVPLYKSLYNNKRFEPLVFYMFSTVDMKKVKDYQEKQKRKIEDMSTEAVTYLNMIRESQELQYTKRETAKPRYYIKDYLVSGKGDYAKGSKNENIFVGPWEFYHANGVLKSKGSFDNAGKRIGAWHFFYKTGLPQETSNYENDKAQGKSEVWHDNGLTYTVSNYVEDELDGTETSYFYNGLLRSVINYKKGKKAGSATYYTVDGYKSLVRNYVDDLQDGDEIAYHDNGQIESKATYIKDEPTGEFNEYYDNGKLKRTGNFAEGKKTGIWKSFYKNGQPEYLENYTKNELDGEYASYYDDGKVETKSVYRKGEVDGKNEDYDIDGILYSETIFEKGRLRDIKFYDKKGTVISNTTSRKGNADITFFSPEGFKTRQGYFTKDGQQEGKAFYYYKNGQVSTEGNYKEGLMEGKRITYYSNGKVSQEGNYAKNQANGYFTNFYNNGQVSSEGWYVNDERQGTFIYYNQFGTITSKVYYLDDKIHGVTEYFHANGAADYTEYYDNAWFKKLQQYDTTGKIISKSNVSKGSGPVMFKHFNGKNYIECNYKNYKLNGSYKVINIDGSIRSQSYYKNGDLDSIYKSWHSNGKLEKEGVYHNGNKTGEWKYYWRSGKLSETELYEDGKLSGKNIQYDEDGLVDKEMDFKKGDLDGECKLFVENKQLSIIFYYRTGTLTGYSYEDKTGKLVPTIPLPGGSGKVTAYFKNGNKSVEMEFSEGLVNGQRNLYFTNGKEYVTGTRINGDDNGVKKVYYLSGKIKKEDNFVYGSLHGSSKYYNENGTLIYDLNYYDNELNGICKYYEAGKYYRNPHLLLRINGSKKISL